MAKIKNNTKSGFILKVLTFSIIWQIVWIIVLAGFEVKERIIASGLVGANCGSCEPQNQLSLLIIMIPLIIGSVLFGGSLSKLAYRENRIVKILIFTGILVLGTVISYYVYGITNFAFNYGS